jgi:integrase/recombinase XerC
MSTPSKLLLSNAQPAESVATLPLGLITREYIQLYAGGVSHTSRAKQLDTDKFLDFLRGHKKKSDIDALVVQDWDFSSTQRFVDTLLHRGEAPATVARRLATLKHMGRIFSERLPGFINPAREVKPPRQQIARPKSIEPIEAAQIKSRAAETSTKKRSFNTIRNETLLRLLLDTGLRADEIRTLRRGQLDDSLEWISQVRTKGRRYRDVYVTSDMRPALTAYLKIRADEIKRFHPTINAQLDARLPLFISTYKVDIGDPRSFEMGAKSVWRAIRNFSVDTKLHPHLLRHTYATDLLHGSKDIRLVAQALGHSDVRVTMRYTERSNEEVAKALEKSRSAKDSG